LSAIDGGLTVVKANKLADSLFHHQVGLILDLLLLIFKLIDFLLEKYRRGFDEDRPKSTFRNVRHNQWTQLLLASGMPPEILD
jgi:hypothetical protein